MVIVAVINTVPSVTPTSVASGLAAWLSSAFSALIWSVSGALPGSRLIKFLRLKLHLNHWRQFQPCTVLHWRDLPGHLLKLDLHHQVTTVLAGQPSEIQAKPCRLRGSSKLLWPTPFYVQLVHRCVLPFLGSPRGTFHRLPQYQDGVHHYSIVKVRLSSNTTATIRVAANCC